MYQYKIIIRQLLRNSSNTVVRILSLTIGLTVSLLVFLQVAHQLNFDGFYPDKDRMYRIGNLWNNRGEIDDSPIIIAPLAQAIRDNLSEVEQYALIRNGWGKSYYTEDKKPVNVQSIFADSTFFRFFNFPVLLRSTNNELNVAYKVWISESTAKKFYGDLNPLGKLIYDSDQKPYEIEGVFKDIPANSHLDFDIVISFETIRTEGRLYTGWGGGDSFNGYVKLVQGANAKSVEAKISDVIAKYYDTSEDEKAGQTETYYLQPITKINTAYDSYKKLVLEIMAGVGLIVLLISVLNFVLLSLSSFQKQIYSLGIQQYSGASKADIARSIAFGQFTQVAVAVIITAIIIKPALSLSGKLWEWGEPVLFNHYSVLFVLSIVGFVLLLSIGLPLAKLQSIKFGITLTKKGSSKTETVGKRILLSGQMIGVTVLIVVLFMLIKQLNYIQSLQLGYQTANRAYITMSGKENKEKAPYLLEQLKQMSFVQSTSASADLVIQGLSGNSFTIPGKEDNYWISRYLLTDKNYHETMGIKMLSGQYFSAFDDNDNNIVIVNRELVKMMNWENPVGQEIISNLSKDRFRVVGVVEDFMHSAYVRKLPAIFYRISQKSFINHVNYISLSLSPGTTTNQVGQIRELLKKESSLALMELSFYDIEVARYYSTERQLKNALMFFALLAIFLAVVGLAGVVLNEVQQRTKEIGIRKVNGATIAKVLTMLNKDFLRWVILSFVVAFPLAYYIVQLGLQSYAYKTEISWWIFALAGLLALGIALLTVSWQSWRAATRNPVEALRYE